MNTKQIGDIAEKATQLKCLLNQWEIAIPNGDRVPYDLIVDTGTKLVKIQVKCLTTTTRYGNYAVGVRRIRLNNRSQKIKWYKEGDYDFMVVYILPEDTFFVLPYQFTSSYSGTITLGLDNKKELPSSKYKEAWYLLNE